MTTPAAPGARIGVDFDNTLADYADLIWSLAVTRDLVPRDFPRSKTAVRDALRAGPAGEDAWRSVQVLAYGEGLERARPMPGARRFLDRAARLGLEVWVVSHKTKYPNFGPKRVNLREKALDWLAREGFLDTAGGIPASRVRFLSTRGAKVTAIRELGLSHFVDDLPEVFLHKRYPRTCQGVLFDPSGACPLPPGVTACRSFAAVEQAVLGLAPEAAS